MGDPFILGWSDMEPARSGVRCNSERQGVAMTGIQYVTDQKGKRVAVQLGLRLHAGLWEEI